MGRAYNLVYGSTDYFIYNTHITYGSMATQEKIVVFRRVWKSGKGKYFIRLPEEIVKHYGLEGKFVKGILEIIEDDHKDTEEH